jgi:hypothetical protein
MEDINKKISEFLTTQLVEKTTRLVQLYFVEFSGNEEAKKTVEANQFMESLLTGKGFVGKDLTFIEKHNDLFDEIHAYSKKITEFAPTPSVQEKE